MVVLLLEEIQVSAGTTGNVEQEQVPGSASAPASSSSLTSRLTRRRSSVTKPRTASKPASSSSSSRKHSTAHKVAAAADIDVHHTIARSLPQPMLPARSIPLLICSIGNPGSQYANTLHSAGHTVLNRLAERLGYPHFHKERTYGNGLLSKPDTSAGEQDWTLWQSTSYMNDSGKGVRAAYMAWSKNIPDGQGRLVVVHDELEKPLGAVSLRTAPGASAKGHNGLKSIMAVIGNTPFARIGVGIGRPVSRTSEDVARYVLKKMDAGEKVAMDASVEHIISKLNQLQQGT